LGRPPRRAVLLAVLWTPFAFWWQIPHDETTEFGNNIAGVLCLPLPLPLAR
jgi:hypothetical protein